MVQEKKKEPRQGVSWAKFFSARNDRVESEQPADSPVAAHAFSGNLIVIVLVVAAIVFLSWGSIRTYFVQRAEIKQVEQNIADLQSENGRLTGELNLWQDDNYVKQQAKSRLFFVTEGDTPYLVTGTDYSSSLADDTSAVALTAPQASWTDMLWGSFQEAALEGQPTEAPSAPSPAVTSPAGGASGAPSAQPSTSPTGADG